MKKSIKELKFSTPTRFPVSKRKQTTPCNPETEDMIEKHLPV